MQPIRIKACSESDLRMLGSLARNIQRVLPVTQADIDAAAALGEGWVVWKVIEVTDPIDNLRGGTQLVIKQNSITPGQNVRRVLIVSGPGGETVIVGPGPSPLLLPDAIANSLQYVKAFGGTEQNGTPTPDAPVDIVSNNGVLKARHQSGLPLGYTLLDYIETSGTQYIDTNLLLSNTSEFEITFQSAKATLNTPVMGAISGGTSFTSTGNLCVTYNVTSDVNAYSVYCDGAAGDATASWNAGAMQDKLKHTIKYNGLNIAPTLDDVDMEQLVPTTLVANTPTVTTWLFGRNNTDSGTKAQTGVRIYDFKVVGIAHFVPCKNASNVIGMYDLVSGQFFTNAGTGDFVAGTAVSDPVEIYADGTVETIEDTIGNTATTEMLLKVGDYQDVQSILDGVVTRNVGVKVLDGTEDWAFRNQSLSLFYATIADTYFDDNQANHLALSTHFLGMAVINTSMPDNSCKCASLAGTNSLQLFVKSTNFAAPEDIKSWLAAQYAAGTPVIVIYPLETPTTESVAGQTLQVQDGDNTLEITQASIDGLELKAEYEQGVQALVEEIEP